MLGLGLIGYSLISVFRGVVYTDLGQTRFARRNDPHGFWHYTVSCFMGGFIIIFWSAYDFQVPMNDRAAFCIGLSGVAYSLIGISTGRIIGNRGRTLYAMREAPFDFWNCVIGAFVVGVLVMIGAWIGIEKSTAMVANMILGRKS